MFKIPSAGTPISCFDLVCGLTATAGSIQAFEYALRQYLSAKWCVITGSGTGALFAILQALRGMSERRNVLLPAYTAPSLILPIRKAGLNPVLCEVSSETLNTGSKEFLERVDTDTLAVMPVHMFGLATDVIQISEQLRGSGTYCIEDACSAMGTTINGHQAGTLGEIGFISFNRGKNLSTLAGGVVTTDREDLAESIGPYLESYPAPGTRRRLRNTVYASALSVAVRPIGYSLLYPLVSKFKYTELHTDFETWSFSDFQAGLGRRLLKRRDAIFGRRKENGGILSRLLTQIESVQLPKILPGTEPVYNQYPVLLPDEATRANVQKAILNTGLESTLLYPDPIHRIYSEIWDGTGKDPFPVATEISKRLLLFPVHSLVPEGVLVRAVEALVLGLGKVR
jgi:perosamine synthetase